MSDLIIYLMLIALALKMTTFLGTEFSAKRENIALNDCPKTLADYLENFDPGCIPPPIDFGRTGENLSAAPEAICLLLKENATFSNKGKKYQCD